MSSSLFRFVMHDMCQTYFLWKIPNHTLSYLEYENATENICYITFHVRDGQPLIYIIIFGIWNGDGKHLLYHLKPINILFSHFHLSIWFYTWRIIQMACIETPGQFSSVWLDHQLHVSGINFCLTFFIFSLSFSNVYFLLLLFSIFFI